MWRLEYIYEINKLGGGIFFCGGWKFSKSVSVNSTFIRELRVEKPKSKFAVLQVTSPDSLFISIHGCFCFIYYYLFGTAIQYIPSLE